MSDEKIEKELGMDYVCVYSWDVDSERLREIEELRQGLEGFGIRSFHVEIECPYRVVTPAVVIRRWEPARVPLMRHTHPLAGLQSGLLSGMPDPERIRRLAGLERHTRAVQPGLGPILGSVGESVRSASDVYVAAIKDRLELQGEPAEESGDASDDDSADDEQLAEIRAALIESRQLGERAQQSIDALVDRAN